MTICVIGLMSGTSVDGIDTALVKITGTEVDLNIELLAGATYPYPPQLRVQILDVCAGKPLSMSEFAALDDAIALAFVEAAKKIQAGNLQAQLIGSHGQTVYHRPKEKSRFSDHELGYSLQLGRGALIAHLTGIPTISNFRVADIAAGGQGAPLVPKVDVCLLSHPNMSRCIQNIGGISNVTYLPSSNHQIPNPKSEIAHWMGWDTGPGNTLLDLAVQYLSEGTKTYDQNGEWAAQGIPFHPLVNTWLKDEYFHQAPPKSTGRELFGWDYFQRCLADAKNYDLNPADLLATLTELTVESIVHSYQTFLPQMPEQVFLCGGGSRNLYLKHRLQLRLSDGNTHKPEVLTTDDVGVSADYKEAIAFAILAYWRHFNIPGNLPQVTGANNSVLLGEIHLPS